MSATIQKELSVVSGSPQKGTEKDAFDKKLREQDSILAGDSPVKIIPEEADDMYDDDGNFDELAAQIKSTVSFKFEQRYLNCTALEGNPIYEKLKKRLMAFFVQQSKHRKLGPDQKTQQIELETGTKFPYIVKLNQCLRTMLRQVCVSDDKQNQ